MLRTASRQSPRKSKRSYSLSSESVAFLSRCAASGVPLRFRLCWKISFKLSATHILLPAGETGLQADCAARAENITVVRKIDLVEPRGRLRQIPDSRICELAGKVRIAMGC